jgi:hypothetical protein
MNTPSLSHGDTDTESAISIGLLTLLATLLVGSLLYLGSYSLGPEFEGRKPSFHAGSTPVGS